MDTLNPRKYVPDKKKKITVTEEFLQAVDEYILAATNESNYYHSVQSWFDISYNRKLSSGFPVAPQIPNLSILINKIRKSDFGMYIDFSEKRTFVQTMLYLHYTAEFVPDYVDMRISDFYEITRKLEPVYDVFSDPNWEPEVNEHIEQANQHFKIVENKMNTLTKFEKEVSATVHLIHGRPAEDYTESELMQLIREAQKNKAAISDLVETSERMKAKSEKYDADIKVYVEALDNLK